MLPPFRVTPIPPPVAAARRLLSAVLDTELRVAHASAISEGLELLLDVDPPYPPLPGEDESDEAEAEPGLDAAAAVDLAIHWVGVAADDDASIADLARYGEVLILLRRALQALDVPTVEPVLESTVES